MLVDDESRIISALEGRRGERARVAQLGIAWSDLTQAFSALTAAVADADQVAKDLPKPSDAMSDIHDAVADLHRALSDRRGIVGRLADVSSRIESLRHRVGRDTVNIGVVGKTRSGKSTLLRTITDLPETVIPSSRYDSTTAAPSRIYHDLSESSALVQLHTWESFRASYLAPLHESAGIHPIPLTAQEFAAYHYPAVVSAREKADLQRFVNRLLVAQQSLPSYEPLLRSGDTRRVPLEELRPYIAYPEDSDPDQLNRPYHAVSGVVIRTPFKNIGVARLGLIDLPGAGEAGLDVDRQFLQKLRDDLDLLLVVKRTVIDQTFWSDSDWDNIGLADSARGGVSLEDFVFIVVNQDKSQLDDEGLRRTTEKMRAEASKRGIPVLTPDAQESETVHSALMEPILRHLAQKLADMDRAATRAVLIDAQEVAAELAELAADAAGQMSGWRAAMPNERNELRARASQLRWALAAALAAISDQYETMAAEGHADPAFQQAISTAVSEARAWTRDGLGTVSRQQWLQKHKDGGALIAEGGAVREREYAYARKRMGEIFGRIDSSIDESVDRLAAEIAEALRGQFTDALVPDGPEALNQLMTTARNSRAVVLPAALAELAELRRAYGSALLRITRPVIRTIADDRLRIDTGRYGVPAAEERGMSSAESDALKRLRRNPSAYGRGESGWSAEPSKPARDPAGSAGAATRRGRSEDGSVPRARQAAEDLYDELTEVIQSRIEDLEQALQAEGQGMLTVLAAATDRFLDLATQTPDVEFEYLDLCGPIQRVLWPDIFDGGPAQLGAGLAGIESAAATLSSAAASIRTLEQ
jgi:hypothetical protein